MTSSDSESDRFVRKAPPKGTVPRPSSQPDTDPTARREAHIGRTQDEKPLGAPIYLCYKQLENLGADLEQEKVTYYVEGGELVFE